MKAEGEISKSMGVDTKPAHRFEINGYWVLIDPKMPQELFEKIKQTAQKQEHD